MRSAKDSRSSLDKKRQTKAAAASLLVAAASLLIAVLTEAYVNQPQTSGAAYVDPMQCQRYWLLPPDDPRVTQLWPAGGKPPATPAE